MVTHTPTSNIVWRREDGSVAITHVFHGIDPEKWRDELIRRGDFPPGSTAVAINAELPADYEARDRWAFEGGKIVVRPA